MLIIRLLNLFISVFWSNFMSNFKKISSLFIVSLISASFLVGCNNKKEPEHEHTYSELIAQVNPTCTEKGMLAHYKCEGCDLVFDTNKNEVSYESLIINALGHDFASEWSTSEGKHFHECNRCHERADEEVHILHHHDKVEPTHTSGGNDEYYECEKCHLLFSDEQGLNQIENVVTHEPLGHDQELTYHPEVKATCTQDGVEAYYECSCGALFSDANGEHEIESPIITPASHNLELHEGVEPTCSEDGVEAYYECSVCHKIFSDENAENEITGPSILPAGHYHIEHVVGKEARGDVDGWIDHYYCLDCGLAWVDENRTIEIGNEITDRSKIDVKGPYSYQFDWDWTVLPYYDEKEGYVYKKSADFETKTPHYLETMGPAVDTNAVKTIGITLTNESDKALTISVRSRAWNDIYVSDSVLPANESKNILISSVNWNKNPSNDNYGISIWCTNNSDEIAKGNITIGLPKFYDFGFDYFYSDVAMHKSDDEWVYAPASFELDDNFDFVNVIKTTDTQEVFFESKDTTTVLEDGKLYYAQVTNNTDKSLNVRFVGRGWAGTAGEMITLSVGETALVYASSITWNSQDLKGAAIRFATADGSSFSGELRVSNPRFDNSYFNRIEAADQGSDYWNNLTVKLGYDKDYGLYYFFDASSIQGALRIYFKSVMELDSTLYSGIRFNIYNGGTSNQNCNAWSEDWGDGQNTVLGVIAPNQWTSVTINTKTWNGNRNTKDVGLYDHGFNGVVKITLGQLISK